MSDLFGRSALKQFSLLSEDNKKTYSWLLKKLKQKQLSSIHDPLFFFKKSFSYDNGLIIMSSIPFDLLSLIPRALVSPISSYYRSDFIDFRNIIKLYIYSISEYFDFSFFNDIYMLRTIKSVNPEELGILRKKYSKFDLYDNFCSFHEILESEYCIYISEKELMGKIISLCDKMRSTKKLLSFSKFKSKIVKLFI